MVSKKKVLFFTDGPKITQEAMDLGRAIGAQFRNGRLVDESNLENCDYVAGAVPKAYADYPPFPAEAAEAIAGTAAGLLGGTPEGTGDENDSGSSEGASDNPDDTQDEPTGNETPDEPDSEGEEVEVTMDLLNRMEKDELLDMAQEEEIRLTNNQKKSAPKIRTAIADHFDLQA